MPDFEILPGLRDHSGAQASHGGHGIDEIIAVIDHLSAAKIPSCVVGVMALYYYGAGRITDEWDLCVPDDQLEAAAGTLLSDGDGAKYEVAKPPPPVPGSLRHTFRCFQLRGYNFWFLLVPSSDCFVDPSVPEHIESSRNLVPYASLVQFARSLLVQQLTADLADLVDGMDLDVEWGEQHIGFKTLQEASANFIGLRNRRVSASGGDDYGRLSPKGMEALWREIASKEEKAKRIEPMKQGRYFTRWRSYKYPQDPRIRDRPV
ncbi:hypothetical protein C8A03DRAFT_46646 [Achaetomium macrosporum]|uniref:Uncharacterized protein n=1 Tax=Achaetomium macrosporum TaxID=79813 RepID=A0AAN7H962_9PEZI|nr:hypothetical protein C8A03DRAFT_46646 [Achaetomium macrosporum]